MTHRNIRIVINVRDGIVQDAACSEEATIVLVDWDTEGCDPVLDELVAVPTDSGTAFAFVMQFNARSLKELVGTGVDKALRRAGIPLIPSHLAKAANDAIPAARGG